MNEETDDNWLKGQTFNCSNCMNDLFRIIHSPFYDCDFCYCDSCPKRVEISFYDKVRNRILDKFGDNVREQYLNIQEVEKELKSCDCGGNFKFDAPRRCIYCASVVIDEGGIDLFPSYPEIEKEKELTKGEIEKFEKFEEEFVRAENIWK